MSDAFQSGAFQFDAFQIDAGTAVFPLPGQVLIGIVYGPNGNDYTGTLVATSGRPIYVFDD